MKSRDCGAVVVIILLIALLFYPVGRFGFLDYDDKRMVPDNEAVRQGITGHGLLWAFGSLAYAANWHPVTWISHMLDVSAFGLDAGAHHAVNVAIHAANSILLFFILRAMTDSFAAALVAALFFAVHPLHVESVVRVAERKDVLSALFALLAVRFYLAYARRPSPLRYGAVMASYAAGLMAKPMIVTLPILLALLDYWPLGRVFDRRPRGAGAMAGVTPTGFPGRVKIAEKLPLLFMAAAAAIVAYLSQSKAGMIMPSRDYPAWARIGNALAGYGHYVRRTILPAGLSPLYPHPGRDISPVKVAAAGALLIAAGALVAARAKSRPYLAAGWSWFVIALLPVIGLVQIGPQAAADRYAYLPIIGLFIMAAWGAADFKPAAAPLKIAAAVSATATVISMAAASSLSVGFWKDDRAMYSRAVSVTADNWLAEYNLGVLAQRRGAIDEAADRYLKTVAIRPGYYEAWNNLGFIMGQRGDHAAAAGYYRQAAAAQPNEPSIRYNLANSLSQSGRNAEAVEQYRESIRLKPENPTAYNNMGIVYWRENNFAEAGRAFAAAVAQNPGFAEAWFNLGLAREMEREYDGALACFHAALRLRPDYREAMDGLSRLAAADRAPGRQIKGR